MPIINIYEQENGAWAVWKITESEVTLTLLSSEHCPANITHPTKRAEFFAARILLREICTRMAIPFRGLHKDRHGKPFLTDADWQISLTHSYPYVAVQVQRHDPVGIDLEQPKPKLYRIASRFLSAAELADAGTDLIKLCIYWSAKEALFKIAGTPGVIFSKDLVIEPFSCNSAGILSSYIQTAPARSVRLQYRNEPDYVLVTTQSVTTV